VETPVAYRDQVRRIAEDRDYAASLRGKLSPGKLFDALGTRRYAAALERAFLAIAQVEHQGLAPRDIVINETAA
jgi:hypothetical protein